MNKEKKWWETKGYNLYQTKEMRDFSISDYQFNIIEKRFDLKKMKILEIGVGSGRDMKRFHKAGAKLSGLDISSKFIEDLQTEFKGTFRTMDTRNIANWEEKDIDLIYSRWSLLFLEYEEFKIFLKDAKKILKPNGKIMISLRAGNSLKNIHKNSKIQSLQLNSINIHKALPPNMEIEFLEIINYESSTNKKDKQITFIISNSIYTSSRDPYLD